MKKITKFIFMAFAAALALTACSPNDDHSFGDLNLTEDQISLNIVPGSEDEFVFDYTISLNTSDKFVYAYNVDFGYGGGSVKGTATSAEDVKGSHEYIARAGTYTAVCTITLPNGVQFTQEKEVVLENDNPDVLGPDPLTGRESKTWVVDGYNVHLAEVKAALPDVADKITGFMGLGGAADGGYQVWWGAGAGDKSFESSGWTLYDTKYTFSADGKLTIETAGEGYGRLTSADLGGFTVLREEGDDMVFSYEGGDYTFERTGNELTISDKGYLTYYAGTQSYEILYLSETALCVRVVSDPDGADWVFILCPQGSETPPPPLEGNWVDVDSEDNLWNGANITKPGEGPVFYYAPGWNPIADPELVVTGSGAATQYALTFPEATTDQWQAQCPFLTDLATSAAESYDFRITIKSNNEFMGATLKFTQEGDDGNFIFEQRKQLEAKENVIELVNLAGKDITQGKLVLDFGGCPAGTEIVVKDIILQWTSIIIQIYILLAELLMLRLKKMN